MPSSNDPFIKYKYIESKNGIQLYQFSQTKDNIHLVFYLENYFRSLGRLPIKTDENSSNYEEILKEKLLKLVPKVVNISFLNHLGKLEFSVLFDSTIQIPSIKQLFRYTVKRQPINWNITEDGKELHVVIEKLETGFWERCFVDDANFIHLKNMEVDLEVIREKRDGPLGCFLSLPDCVNILSEYWRDENLLHY